MMDQILGRDWDWQDDRKTAFNWRNGNNTFGRSGWGVKRYPYDGHGGMMNNTYYGGWGGDDLPDDAEASKTGYGGWWNPERRNGWQGLNRKHGEYEDYDPYDPSDTDGDDKEHEGYYTDDYE